MLLGEGLSGRVVATIQAHRVVHRKSGVPPAQEGLSELLRDEAQLKEHADGALTQELGQACGVVDGKVVELALGVEASFQYQGMEVGVEPKRVAKGLIGEHGGGGEGPGGRGGVELGDQRENEPGDPTEEAQVVAKEDAKSLGEREDKLPVGQGEQQLLVEVLGEQEGPLLAAGGAEVESRQENGLKYSW